MKLSGENLQFLADHSWLQIDNAFPESALLDLKSQALGGFETGQFEPAKVGRSQEQSRLESIRSDSIWWIDFHSPSFKTLKKHLEDLRMDLNEKLFLNLQTFEAHFTCYQPGQKYDEHVDQARLQSPLHGERVISFVLYLNENWGRADGGELCLHLTHEIPEILPVWNRLMLFQSKEIRHSVKAGKNPRWTLTGWFRRT